VTAFPALADIGDRNSHGIVGNSDAIHRVRTMVDSVAPTNLPVLIQGPTGAGKELVAAALHAGSGRQGAFVPFNVCAVGDAMFEDALFGHVRGAFTGAVSDIPGFLREANNGTLFLDEVSGLAPSLQAKLLRAIETGVFRPVGARADTRSAFRVVAATNERLDRLVASGRFREDLSQRLRGVTIVVPPLAERMEDVAVLVRHFLDRAGAARVEIDRGAIDVLTDHHWPGNVRELRHVVEWSAVFCNGHLTSHIAREALAQRAPARAADTSLAFDRLTLCDALESHDWDTLAAARSLGVHRATLYRRMKRLGLEPRRDARAVV
jgi:DNA-binding NtrC family response regulator